VGEWADGWVGGWVGRWVGGGVWMGKNLEAALCRRAKERRVREE